MDLNNKSLFKEKCFVNGLWADGQSGKTIEVNNPATMEIIGKVPNFTPDETKSVIEHADEAFHSWKNTTAKERSIILVFNIRGRNKIRISVITSNNITSCGIRNFCSIIDW